MIRDATQENSAQVDYATQQVENVNVLYLITTLRPYGGAEVALANLIPYLSGSSLNVWVGAVFGRDEEEVRIELPGNRVEHFEFARRYYTDLMGYRRLVTFLRTNNIDVIHTHLFAANTVGRIAGWLAGVPAIISTEHNTYVNKSRAWNAVDSLLARVTSKIVAVSDSVLTHSSTQTGVDTSLYERIPNCVPIDRIRSLDEEEKAEKRNALGIEPDSPVILSVGRLTEQKGFSYLLRAAREVVRKIPQAVFLVAGKGELREELESEIGVLGLDQSVRLLGFRNDVYDLMQISSVFAMSSLWEGLPVTLIEAGACKLPVVATAVGGIMEVIESGKNGLIVPIGDEQALAKGLISVLSSPEARTQMGICARQLAETHFSGPAVARRIELLYRQCLGIAQA